MSFDKSWGLESTLWWNVFWFAANGVLLGRRAYVLYKEEGLSACRKFDLRAKSLSYVTIWAIFAISTVVFASLPDDRGDAVNTFGILVGEYVAVCLWSHYFGHGSLILRIVMETRARMNQLLVVGLGMNATERELFWNTAEQAIIDLWTRQLKRKSWTSLSNQEKSDWIFETGLECGKILEKQWEGILHDVEAYFHEWRTEIEDDCRPIRLPKMIAESLKQGLYTGSEGILCVATIIANEDEDVRKKRGCSVDLSHRQFSASRIAKRKAAAEGILRWPNWLAVNEKILLDSIESNSKDLVHVDGTKDFPIKGELPQSVMATLSEIVKTGYIKLLPQERTEVPIEFKYGNMVVHKDHWNSSKAIERKPFRFLTSATWMAGHPAFMVEQREETGADSAFDGSASLKGTLTLSIKGKIQREENSWILRTCSESIETEIAWGQLEFLQGLTPIHFVNRPMLYAIHAAWIVIKIFNHISMFFQRTKASTQETLVSTRNFGTMDNLFLSDSRRRIDDTIRTQESQEVLSTFCSSHQTPSRQPSASTSMPSTSNGDRF